MNNIFNRPTKKNSGGFSIDTAQLNFTGAQNLDTTGLLVQGLQIQYQQQVTFLYDLANPNNVYYVAGRAQGTLQMAKVVGSSGVQAAFYTAYGDVCSPQLSGGTARTIQLSFNTNCTNAAGAQGTGQEAEIVIANPIITSFGMRMQVNEGIINEDVTMQFSDLEVVATGSASANTPVTPPVTP
jgi:hypothetical protein